MTDPNEFLTLPEVSDLLRISTATARRLMKKREFPTPVKVGRQLRWNRQSVMEYFGAHDETPEPTVHFNESFQHLIES